MPCRCLACGAWITWVRAKGAKMPTPMDFPGVRFYRSAGGKRTFMTADGEVVRGNPTKNKAGETGYTSHYLTCKGMAREGRQRQDRYG